MPTELSEEQINKVLHGISIPPQPQIMVDLQMEQASEDFSINRIAELISQDIGLAGSILKTVNSPFFGLKNKITAIQQAINLLGTTSVVNIVNALSIRSSLSDDDIVSLGRFWDSAMDIAMACTAVAKQINFAAPDEAYTLGLFHNCGIPLLMLRFDNFSEVVEKSYKEPQKRVIDVENALVKTNHAVVGYYVAKSWNLPRPLCDAIANHHSGDKIFADENYADTDVKTLIAIVKIAEHLCANYRMLGNQSEDFEWQRLEEPLLEFVSLNQDDLANLKDTIEEMGCGTSGYLQL